jgi:N-acetylglucosaminyl-diphospho-decaprenol L-rhamnosyltransferase
MVDRVSTETSQFDSQPTLAILIVNYNSWADVSRLVASLAGSAEVADGRCEVVVIDNASDAPIPVELACPPNGVRTVTRSENGGFAVGVNAGWRTSRARWVLLLNPDVVAGNDLPGRILERIPRLESRPAGPPAVVGFALRNADGSRQPSVGTEPTFWRCLREAFIPRSRRKYQADRRAKPGSVPWVTGAFALVDTALLRVLGGMDEDFFLYYEEVALCRSASDVGRGVEYDPTVEVVHLRPLQSREVSPRLRVITRHSKLLFFRKHRPRWEFLALSWVVSVESAIRSLWSWARRHPEHYRAWVTIRRLARAMRRGVEIRGRDVLALAEGHSRPGHPTTITSPHSPLRIAATASTTRVRV